MLSVLLCAAASAPMAALAGGPASGFASKPHILLVVVDDLGWANVGWHNPDMITPRSDALVADGIAMERSYVFQYCAPTRSSIMSGRLPYHVNQIILGLNMPDWDMPSEMTAMPKVLKQAGYATHMVGKWHVGVQSPGCTPAGRGFDTSMGFMDGAEDHWTQASCHAPCSCNCPTELSTADTLMKLAGLEGSRRDMWCTDKPCYNLTGNTFKLGRNGGAVGDIEKYGDYQYTQEAMRIIADHDPSIPLFSYIAFQNNHEPLEAPDEYIEMYPSSWREDRRWYAAMTSYWDASLGNITDLVKAKGMWNDTLLIMTTDNGGPTYWVQKPNVSDTWMPEVFPNGWGAHGGGASNWPFRGSKVSNWEGGTRGASFVSGGFLPVAMRGTVCNEKVHVADYYATFAHLAGVDPEDPNTVGVHSDGTKYALPPVESLNLWSLLSGENNTSPRDEVPICIDHPLFNGSSALIVGDYKLLLGPQNYGYWQGPAFPNGTDGEPYWPGGEKESVSVDCGDAISMEGGCLFDVENDPHETTDLAAKMPDTLHLLKARFLELKATGLDQRSVVAKIKAGTVRLLPNFLRMLKKNNGFIGPYCPEGVCAEEPPLGEPLSAEEASYAALGGSTIKTLYELGGPYPGFKPVRPR